MCGINMVCQDVAAALDEEDMDKFTDAIKEFDSMTPLVNIFVTPLILRGNNNMSYYDCGDLIEEHSLGCVWRMSKRSRNIPTYMPSSNEH